MVRINIYRQADAGAYPGLDASERCMSSADVYMPGNSQMTGINVELTVKVNFFYIVL